jgi:hypothetical protein
VKKKVLEKKILERKKKFEKFKNKKKFFFEKIFLFTTKNILEVGRAKNKFTKKIIFIYGKY